MADRADGQTRRAVILAGGWMHRPEEPVAALTELLEADGLTTEVITEPGLVSGALAEPPDLLAIAACWFSMTDDRYDDDQRAAWAVPRDAARERALLGAADAGVPVLALHTAVICFDGWPPWADWLGGTWDWDSSFHPPPAELRVVPEPGTDFRIQPFTVVDEEYQGLTINPEVRVLARSPAGSPLVWLRDGDRRAAVNVLGHDARSLCHPAHRRLLSRLVTWLLD